MTRRSRVRIPPPLSSISAIGGGAVTDFAAACQNQLPAPIKIMPRGDATSRSSAFGELRGAGKVGIRDPQRWIPTSLEKTAGAPSAGALPTR
jgi:hypothetical protein